MPMPHRARTATKMGIRPHFSPRNIQPAKYTEITEAAIIVRVSATEMYLKERISVYEIITLATERNCEFNVLQVLK